MKTILKLMAFLCTMSVCVNALASDWVLKKETEGVKVYTREVAGRKYKELMGVYQADVPFEVAVEVAKDYDHYYEWYGMCKTLRVISKKSPRDVDMYFVLDTPVVTNRDAVVNVKSDYNYSEGIAKITFKGIDSPYMKGAGLVRMPVVDGNFTLSRINLRKTKVVYTVYVDMGGILPAWVANLAATKHPFDTGVGILKQVKKAIYAERAKRAHGENQGGRSNGHGQGVNRWYSPLGR